MPKLYEVQDIEFEISSNKTELYQTLSLKCTKTNRDHIFVQIYKNITDLIFFCTLQALHFSFLYTFWTPIT